MNGRTHSPITPYVAARVASRLLGEPISEQTMFSLAKHKRIATVSVPGSKKIHFDGDAFARWLRQRKENPTGSRVDYSALIREFGEELGSGSSERG